MDPRVRRRLTPFVLCGLVIATTGLVLRFGGAEEQQWLAGLLVPVGLVTIAIPVIFALLNRRE